MSSKNITNEKDIEIITLSDSNLKIFSPPSNISPTRCTYPISPDRKKKQKINERANFIFSSKDEYLGVGGFSKVYKFRGDLENKAVKKVMVDPLYYSKALTAVDSIKREIYGMVKINCKNSLQVYGVFQNNLQNTFFILMEQCQGNMEKYIQDRGSYLNVYEVIILLCQLNNAFHLLDVNNIIHRDVKPSNILYKEEKVFNRIYNKKIFGGKNLIFKLGDYGVCLPLYENKFSKSQFMGTLHYMAPEIYKMRTEKEHPIYTKKIDLFSLGQSILCMMGFIKKASTLNEEKIIEIKNICTLFEGNEKEKLLADLIFNHLLICNPDKRDNWEEYLNHPIFKQNYNYEYYSRNKSEDKKNRKENIEKINLKRNNNSHKKYKVKYIDDNSNEILDNHGINKNIYSCQVLDLRENKIILNKNNSSLNMSLKNKDINLNKSSFEPKKRSNSTKNKKSKINDNNNNIQFDLKNINIYKKKTYDYKNKNIKIDKEENNSRETVNKINKMKFPIYYKRQLKLFNIENVNNNKVENENKNKFPLTDRNENEKNDEKIIKKKKFKRPNYVLSCQNDINLNILKPINPDKDKNINGNVIYNCNTMFKINNIPIAEIDDTSFNNNNTRNVRYFNTKRRGKKAKEQNNDKKNIVFYLSKNTKTKHKK